jgi:hypothetical protein
MVVLGGGAVSYEKGTPVNPYTINVAGVPVPQTARGHGGAQAVAGEACRPWRCAFARGGSAKETSSFFWFVLHVGFNNQDMRTSNFKFRRFAAVQTLRAKHPSL